MSQIKLSIPDTHSKSIIEKANKILSIPQSELNSTDKTFISYVKYIFSSNFTLSNKKKDKKANQYLKNYIEILFQLFEKTKEERESLYNANKSKFGKDLSDLFENLKSLVDNSNKTLLNDKERKHKIYFALYALLCRMPKTLSSYITLYFFSLMLFIPEIDTFKLLLFNLMKEKFTTIFESFDFEEFLLDLDNPNCLNLIQLYFKNLKENKHEILKIYSCLIFKYKDIFSSFENEIDFKILQRVAYNTLVEIEQKNIKDKDIGIYIDSYFFSELKNTLEPQKNIIKISNENIECDEKNKINMKERENNISSNFKNNKLSLGEKTKKDFNNGWSEGQSTKFDLDNVSREKNIVNNNEEEEKEENEKEFNLQENMAKSFISKNFFEEMEKIRNEMKSENKRLEEKINKTESENGSLKENMNKIKSENESLKEKINEMKSEYEEKMNNIKNDNSKKSEEIKKLNNKIITMQKDNRNEINELNSTLKVMLLDKGKKEIEINKFKNNLNKLKNEIKDIKKVLGTIQVRDLAKSFLNQFR